MKLSELLRRRSALAAQSADLAAKAAEVSTELGRIDAELFSRMKSLVVAIEGDSQQDEPLVVTTVGKAEAIPIQTLFGGSIAHRAVIRRTRGLGTHILSALKEAGRPMDRNALYDALVSRGVEIPGKDPKANLSAHLSYMQNIKRTEDGLWALTQPQEVSQ